MNSPAPVCPACHNTVLTNRGEIPPSTSFSSQPLATPLLGGNLYHCQNCQLGFRHPHLSKGEMDRLYEQTPPVNWQYTPDGREDWKIAVRRLKAQPQLKRVLDVGCFDGGFLHFLGDGYQRFGLEINPAAAERAERRGITMVGSDFADLARLEQSLDAVIAMDVIEHVGNPLNLVKVMGQALKPGGLLMISTGNTEAWSWKLMGSRYWYCHNPEHIAFINPAWCRQVGVALGLELVGVETFSHSADAGPLFKFKETLKNLALKFFPAITAHMRQRGFGGIDTKPHPGLAYTPPMWVSAEDHFMAIFKKL